MVPEVDAATEAGRLIHRLPELWGEATPEERHDLLATMLDGVYVDIKESRTVVGLKPKAPFKAVFQIATAREGSGVALLPKGQPRLHRRGLIRGRAYGGDGGESDYAGHTGDCRSSMP